jgi:hypothetical protein
MKNRKQYSRQLTPILASLDKTPWRHGVPLASLIFILVISVSAQEPIAPKVPLGETERMKVAEEVVAHPDLSDLTAQGTLRAISVKPRVQEKDEPSGGANLAEVILFSYGEGRAYRVLYDPATRRILKRDPLPGRPQPSQEEINEALDLIRSDPEHAKLLSSGNVLEGGFAVDGPPDSPTRDRFVQIQMLSPDRKNFVRIITVDLTAKKIVASVRKH